MEVHHLPSLKGFAADRPRFQLLHDSEMMRVVLFSFQPGQAVSPHSVGSEIAFYVAEGEGVVQVGREEQPLPAGSLVFCPPGELHGIKARREAVVLAVITPRPE